MFRNEQELNETFEILCEAYKNNAFIYKPFEKLKSGKIVFEGDSYYDPVLTMLNLRDKGILEFTMRSTGEEKDEIMITGCNIEALRKLKTKWPTWQDTNEIVSVFDGIGPKEEKQDKSVTLMEGDTCTFVSADDWNAYWQSKGKNGPASGWEIPTSAELYKTLGLLRNTTSAASDAKDDNQKNMKLN